MEAVFEWFKLVFNGFVDIASWMITPLDLGVITISPLAFCGATTLIIFLGVAITKWILS